MSYYIAIVDEQRRLVEALSDITKPNYTTVNILEAMRFKKESLAKDFIKQNQTFFEDKKIIIFKGL